MIEICAKDKCTACTACFSVCPKHAITMEADSLGFLYPSIDQSKCIDCGLCVKICPVNNPVELSCPQYSIAGYSKDCDDRKTSASGGAASVFSTYILRRGGVVYGCVQENVFQICHKRIAEIKDSNQLKGSKYVHSPLGQSFQMIKKDLKDGLEVLFIGTPCQCAGLKNFLRKEYDNLYVIDICCHGVPSQKFLKDEIYSLQRKGKVPYEVQNVKVSFRKKFFPAKDKLKYGFFLDLLDKRIYSSYVPNNNYISGFLSGLFFRPNCFKCTYASKNRCTDITLADHWGMGKSLNADMNVQRGLSTFLITSAKGKKLFDEIKPHITYEERSWSESINGNGQFLRPEKKPITYEDFQKCYLEKGYASACRKYLLNYKLWRWKYNIKSSIRNTLRNSTLIYKIYKLLHR